MRIIAGSAKGRRLKSPKKNSHIKPMLSRARQSFFDTVRPWVTGSHFLDLYAGSGVVGLEALSRGASFVVFVEKSREGVRLIENNLNLLGFKDRAMVFSGDIISGGLLLLRSSLAPDFRFDIAFCAPPYLGEDRRGQVLRMSVPTVEQVVKAGILEKNAWMVLQHHKKEPFDGMPLEMRRVRESKFGESILTYMKLC